MTDRHQIHEAVTSHFEAARERPGTTYEPDRFLAHLTRVPAKKGTRVADTFAGRRRLIRFVHAVQLDFGICFTNQEWERGYTLDEFVRLVEKKTSKPEAAARLGRERVRAARMHLTDGPLKLGLLASPLLAGAVFTPRIAPRLILGVLWLTIAGGAGFIAWRDYAYYRTLDDRISRGERRP